jgi:hypothetical protein
MTRRETPKFTGITTYADPQGRFTFRYPTDWHAFDIKEVAGEGERQSPDTSAVESPPAPVQALVIREGLGVVPNPDDPDTLLTAWVAPLEEHVIAEDLDDLKAGVDAGLAELEDCHVEASSDTVLGNLIKFERIYTFRDPATGATRKRKQWLLYVDEWLMSLTWQGSSPEEYQYWLAMANQSFFSFNIPEALWFATDRDLAGAGA